MQKCRRYRPCGLSRWRGEHRQIQPARLSAWFISLARGTHPAVSYESDDARFIPGAGNTAAGVAGQENLVYLAGAGNTAAQHKECWFQPVYSLARGTRQLEHTLSRSVRFISLARGTQHLMSAPFQWSGLSRWRGEHGSPGRSSQILTGLFAGAGTHRYRSLISASWWFIRWRGEHISIAAC